MKLGEIYAKAVKKGIELDPRGSAEVARELERAKKEFDELKDRDKKRYDAERLENPYSDTRILYGDPEKEINNIFVGIDMEVGEVLLAERLKERGTAVDLILAHHPEGRAMAYLSDVMDMQSGILLKYGVPINVAEDIMEERIKEVERRLLSVNHTRAVDAARLLDIPFMCVHTPADNAVADYLQRLFDDKKPYTVSDIVDLLEGIPEYMNAVRETVGPKVVCGSGKRKAGR
ncbi:MAG: NGG1p interacting factor NIF3, partial [Deltaproteobacteria bacterium]